MIIRGKRPSRFYVLPMSIVNDRRLDALNLGVLIDLLSKPDDWNTNSAYLQERFNIGRDKARRILNELVEYGYASKSYVKDSNGQFVRLDFTLFESPVESPETDLPAPENKTLTKDLLLSNNTLSNKSATENQSLVSSQRVVDSFNETLSMLPQVNVLTAARSKSVQARVKEYKSQGADKPEFWDKFWDYCTQSPFLTNQTDWKNVNFDWIIKPTNFAKVFDGNYHKE